MDITIRRAGSLLDVTLPDSVLGDQFYDVDRQRVTLTLTTLEAERLQRELLAANPNLTRVDL